jgi:hypothetical protein
MKRYLLLLILSIAFRNVLCQSSWVMKLNDYYIPDNQYLHLGDVVTGVKKISECADGTIFALAKMSQESRMNVVKIEPVSGTIIWSNSVGFHGSLSGACPVSIKPTRDSGFILIQNYWSQSMCQQVRGTLDKYDKSGNYIWSASHTQYPCFDRWAFDAVERQTGGYWLIAEDVTYKLDENGVMIDSIFKAGKKIFELPNGDLVIQTTIGSVERVDTLGNTLWSVPVGGNYDIAISPNFSHIFVTNGLGIKKIQLINGTEDWTKAYGSANWSALDMTADGGFVAANGLTPSDFFFSSGGNVLTNILRCDTAGDTLWTRQITFPEYGASALKCMPDGKTIFGSGFLAAGAGFQFFDIDYKALCASLDSNGHGPIENTSYMWPGDANNNQLVNFVDDALYMVLANGITGPARPVFNTICMGPIEYGRMSDFGEEWLTSFGIGVNHKNADYDRSGLVDTSDVSQFASLYTSWQGFPDSVTLPNPFRKIKNIESQNLLYEFSLVPENDTVIPGDNIKIYMIAGSIQNPIDTVCGFAFSLFANPNIITIDSISLPNNDLGLTGTDLYTFTFQNFNNYKMTALTCRTDHQNVTNLNDTIGVVYAHVSPTIIVPTTVPINIDEFNAVKADGYPISFNILNGSVFVYPIQNEVHEKLLTPINVYPNPVSEELRIDAGYHNIERITINKPSGQLILEDAWNVNKNSIQMRNMPSGIYYVSIWTNDSVMHFQVAVQH